MHLDISTKFQWFMIILLNILVADNFLFLHDSHVAFVNHHFFIKIHV